MGAVVAFNYSAWVARYPEFAAVSPTAAGMYFNEATLYQRNDGTGPICDPTIQLTLLNMLTAHIAALYNNQPSNSPVGRISNATEGSVTGAFEYSPPATASQAWANQTKYGAQWWAATSAYRTIQYRSPPRRNMNPWPWGLVP